MKIINFVTFDVAHLTGFTNHYISGESTIECLKTFSDLFMYFKLKHLVDIIEIPEDKWYNIQVFDEFSSKPYSESFEQILKDNNKSRLLGKEIKFEPNYLKNSIYYWIKNERGFLSEVCPVMKKHVIGSGNYHTCKNNINYSYDNCFIVCHKLNEIKNIEELKLYVK